MSRGFAPTHAPHRLLLPSTKRVVFSEEPHYTTLGRVIGGLGCSIERSRCLLRSFLLSYLQFERASTSARATWLLVYIQPSHVNLGKK